MVSDKKCSQNFDQIDFFLILSAIRKEGFKWIKFPNRKVLINQWASLLYVGATFTYFSLTVSFHCPIPQDGF